MAELRTSLIERMQVSVGKDIFKIKDIRDGWPAHISVVTSKGEQDISLHVSGVGPHHRPGGALPHERRYIFAGQGRPVLQLQGTIAIAVGLSTELSRTVIAAAEQSCYGLDGIDTRKTVLFNIGLLEGALAYQWSSHINDKMERVYAFVPRLLPLLIEIETSGIQVDDDVIGRRAIQSGLLTEGADEERAKRSVATLVRSARFSGEVREAYGHRCAMCDLGMEIVVGAHIWPVAAKGSSDHVTNGLALCENHHSAFDRHLIGVTPDTFEIRVHPDIQAKRPTDKALDHFLKGTRQHLRKPSPGAEPNPQMFVERHVFIGTRANWITAGS